MSIYERPESPLADALEAVTGHRPPFPMKGIYHTSELEDSVFGELEDWCATHYRPYWATGTSMLDAAEVIVRLAVEGANIPDKES